MKLTVISSGSIGNCYLLHNDRECLVLEAGVSFKEVKKALDFKISIINGVLVTHEHQDHAKYISDYMNAGINVYSSDETQEALRIITGEYCKSMEPNKSYRIGNFTVKSFEVVHDVPCLGYLIIHPEFGRLLFVTDTEYVAYRFKNLNHILIEANYSKELIGEYHKSLGDRVKLSHMEIDTTCEFLRSNNNSNLMNVVLLHLSDYTSNEVQFIAKAKKVVNSSVYVATKGLEIDLNTDPF